MTKLRKLLFDKRIGPEVKTETIKKLKGYSTFIEGWKQVQMGERRICSNNLLSIPFGFRCNPAGRRVFDHAVV